MRITESGYETHYRQEVISQFSNLIYTRVSQAIVRLTQSGYKTHYRQEVDWKYSVSSQIYSSQSCYCENNMTDLKYTVSAQIFEK